MRSRRGIRCLLARASASASVPAAAMMTLERRRSSNCRCYMGFLACSLVVGEEEIGRAVQIQIQIQIQTHLTMAAAVAPAGAERAS